jgi:hypothetical protein
MTTFALLHKCIPFQSCLVAALANTAQLLFTVSSAFTLTCVAYGAGQPTADIQPQSNIPIILKVIPTSKLSMKLAQLNTLLQWWWAGEPVYILCNMMLKFSIGAFLLRIAITKTYRLIIFTVIGVSAVVCTYCFFIIIFQCWPVAYFWGQFTGMEGSCINPNIITISTYTYSAMSCWSDWTYCILPAFMIWNLQMNRRSKFSICAILGVGSM